MTEAPEQCPICGWVDSGREYAFPHYVHAALILARYSVNLTRDETDATWREFERLRAHFDLLAHTPSSGRDS